mgnify:FL=1
MHNNINRYLNKISGRFAANLFASAKHVLPGRQSPHLSPRELRRIVAEMLG